MLDHERVVAQIRVTMTLFVGWLASLLVNWGVDIDTTGWAGALTVLVTAVYYGTVRWLAEHFPQVGWLFGVNKKPSYNGTTFVPDSTPAT